MNSDLPGARRVILQRTDELTFFFRKTPEVAKSNGYAIELDILRTDGFKVMSSRLLDDLLRLREGLGTGSRRRSYATVSANPFHFTLARAFRRSAQYRFILADTAFRAAADI
jgi:hypothetical protein